MGRPSTLNVTNIGELAAFLAFWLSPFVLLYHIEVIRPETFVMASLMVKGQKISLAPTVLGYIYHGLGQVECHLNHLGRANPCFPIHYIVVFSALYSQRPDSECPVDYPTLMRYPGIEAKAVVDMISHQDSTQALLANRVRVFRSLKILHSLVDESHLSTIEIFWFTSKVEEAFIIAEIVAKMKGLVDIQRLCLLFSQDSAYTSEIAHMEKERLQMELAEAGVAKLQNLEKEKN
ncbi:hypothetical protein Cgig2_017482 [Carnegiea gigantea]|uniref:Uncharacterized protein n=1 Tax=Carnegiea gigantea TaxID=171969 RepID=A0A9Q1GIV4_9CARY|nr:hypothetical protein Cgig2_017482 [Carnegiea gigantea]